MNAWLEFIIIWLILDTFIMAGVWFAIHFIKPKYPEAWQRIIVDDEPGYPDHYK
jgi:hypothetical protein